MKLSFRKASVLACLFTTCAAKGMPEVVVEIRNHLFSPQVITIPANQKVKITFYNFDPTPEEIDSFDLNREKVVFGNSRASIYVGPLRPGQYDYFGEFHPNSAVGVVKVVEEGDAANVD